VIVRLLLETSGEVLILNMVLIHQILRYGRGIEPMWISGENIPQEKDIPDCPCGAKRIFEFQVWP
jgi:hypothetical protein